MSHAAVTHRSPPPHASGHLTLVTVAWGLAVTLGVVRLMQYDATPAAVAATTRVDWPADVPISLDRDRPTLVMLLHPLCPCSRASVAELDALLTAAGTARPASAFVVFAQPDGIDGDPEATALWHRAAQVRGVTLVRDLGGEIAQRFDAATSGETLLFDPRGTLRFRGGITAARGRVGENSSRTALASRLVDEPADALIRTPVFGCPLR